MAHYVTLWLIVPHLISLCLTLPDYILPHLISDNVLFQYHLVSLCLTMSHHLMTHVSCHFILPHYVSSLYFSPCLYMPPFFSLCLTTSHCASLCFISHYVSLHLIMSNFILLNCTYCIALLDTFALSHFISFVSLYLTLSNTST